MAKVKKALADLVGVNVRWRGATGVQPRLE
jgi:hypothetical protein